MYNYNYYPTAPQQQNFMRQPQQQNLLKGHPVSSLDEAKAASIDFDGSIFFFPDPANKKIYTKQINLDGTATLSVYEFKPLPVAEPQLNTAQYITREEFETTMAQLRSALQAPPELSPQVSNAQKSDFTF